MSQKYKKKNCYTISANKFKEKLNNREYRLGLDLGVGSIGYCAVAMEEKDGVLYPGDVIILGSRIFQSSLGASDRREKRGQRNSIRHKRNRLINLWKLLAENEMMLPYKDLPTTNNTADCRFSKKIQKQNPYELRFRGLREKLSLEELGYCLYHISNHRGSSSVRTFLDQEVSLEEKQQRELEEKTEKLAKEVNINTYIEILYKANQDAVIGFRNLKTRTNIPLPTRDTILNETDKLLSNQKQYHICLTDELMQKIKNTINYENEKLVPESGYCPFFNKEKKLPKCHFLNEERRIWEALNNSRLLEPVNEKNTIVYKQREFSINEKQILFSHLRDGKEITPKIIKKLLPQYLDYKFSLQGKTEDTQKIVGFRFKNLEKKAFWNRFSEIEQDNFLSTWVNCADDQKLKEIMKNEFKLTEEESIDALRTVQLVGDYAPVGKTAMKILMEFIVKGNSWTEAIDKAIRDGRIQITKRNRDFNYLPYYGEVLTNKTQALMGKAWHSSFKNKLNTKGFKKPHTAPKEEQFGRIANPVVHQVLNETQKIVNELIDILGKKPKEIAIETSRELKVGEEKRTKIIKEQANREKERESIFNQFCKPNNLPPKYIKHFDLMKKQQCICPYCLNSISVDMIGKTVDIDHIFPESDTGDSSESNLVLAHTVCNQMKGKRIPFSAFGGTPKWPEILHYLETTPALKFKRWRFLYNERDYEAYLKNRGFTSRFKSDTSYITKIAQEYLSCLYPQEINEKEFPVTTLQGGVTAILRTVWDLQSITYELGSLHISENNELPTNLMKSRQDNRHHALDALVISYCTKSYVKLINTLHAKGIPLSYAERKIPVPLRLAEYASKIDQNFRDYTGFFKEEVRHLLRNEARVSIKYNTDKNGQLLKDTIYNILFSDKNNLVFLVKKKISEIDTKKITNDIEGSIYQIIIPKMFSGDKLLSKTEEQRKIIEKLLSHNKKQYNKILLNLNKAKELLKSENEIAEAAGKKSRNITESLIAKKAFELTGGFYWSLSNATRQKVFVVREPNQEIKGYAYDTGDNLCLDFYHDKHGKLQAELVRKIDAATKGFIPNYKKAGYVLLERIYQGDTIELNAPESKNETGLTKLAKITLPNSISNRAIVRITTFTATKSGFQIFFSHIAKSKTGQDASFTLSTMQKCNVRKVVLSPLGFVEYASKVLKDKDCE